LAREGSSNQRNLFGKKGDPLRLCEMNQMKNTYLSDDDLILEQAKVNEGLRRLLDKAAKE